MSKRYIEVPIFLYSSYEQEILDKNPHELEVINCIRKIDIDRIECYSEAIPLNEFEENNKIWTSVIMHSGHEFIVDLPMNEFEKLIQSK